MKTRLAAASFGLSMAAAVFLLAWPVYMGSDGARTTHATLLEVNGPWFIVPVLFPVVVALMALLSRRRAVRILAAVVIGAFCLIAMSIGIFYVPAAIVMAWAACVAEPADARP